MTDTPRFQSLCSRVVTLMEHLKVPGVSIGVWHAGEEHVAGFGVTHIDHPQPVTPDTLFQIGSISKTFVGTAVMHLLEQGKVSLDTPVKTYVPALKLQDAQAEAGVTLRHLLSHTAGWLGDYFNDFGFGDDALATYVQHMAGLPQWTPLGALFSYNNAGYSLIGRVIEQATQQPFEAAMKQLVFDPLGLDKAFYFPWEVMLHPFAAGHTASYSDDQLVKVATPWEIGRAGHPMGGVVTNIVSLLRYARFHMGDGEGVLSADSIHATQQPQVQSNLTGEWRGLSWVLRDVGPARVVSHGGATNGQMATFQFCPAQQFAITMLTNSDRGGELTSQIVSEALKAYLNAETPQPAYTMLDAPALDEYCGTFRAPLADMALSKDDAGGLWMDTTPRGGFPKPDSPPGPKAPACHIRFAGKDIAYAIDGAAQGGTVEFLRDEAGHIAWVRRGGRVHKRL
jgi:CubicO group peptidase (beta-lactamase class C family)